jgi:gliding motility-associated protein GldE
MALNPEGFSIIALSEMLLLMVLLICSGLVSGAEVAFFSIGPTQRKELEEIQDKASVRILKLLENPRKLLATILIANNFVNVAIILLSAQLTNSLLEFGSNLESIIFNSVVITFIILVLGEVIPKVYAARYPIQLSSIMAGPMQVLEVLFSPGSSILTRSTRFIDKRLNKKVKSISVDDLSQALEITSNQVTDEEEQKILEGIVKFGSIDVKQIMTPRVDVQALNIDMNYDDVVKTIVDSGFSRIPAFKDRFDQIEGILYVKDLLPHLHEEPNFEWSSLLREPFYVTENKKIDDLLNEFQERKMHLAVVVDEYGGASGIVTMEDVIEEIVGEISDEFDDDDPAYSKLDEHNFVFEGKTPLNDLYRVLDIQGEAFEKAKGESDTLAGFVIEQAGKILRKNERIKFKEYTFTIEAADKRRIKQIKVTINPVEINE